MNWTTYRLAEFLCTAESPIDPAELEIVERGDRPVNTVGHRLTLDPEALVWIALADLHVQSPAVVIGPPGCGHRSHFNDMDITVITHANPRLAFALIAPLIKPPNMQMTVVSETRGLACQFTDGFGWINYRAGQKWAQAAFPHYAGIRIGSDCTIHPTACIARGALLDTVIGDHVRIDNMVHIAHGVNVGDCTTIAALTSIEGSVSIGRRCTIGSGVTFQIGSSCGDEVTVGSGSVVTKHIPFGETWVGVPARKIR